jgi:hypothetical protein
VRLISSLLLLLLIAADISGQEDTLRSQNDSLSKRFFLLQNVNRDGVTMPEVEIKEVTVVARPTRDMRRDFRRYERLVSNLKRVYPYAYLVRLKLDTINAELEKIEGEKARKDYIKNVEKDVFGEYEDDMRQLTITQGRLLIKLIDRETQNTSYDLIREYRGWFSAVFWQGIARIFGTNLKDEYDASGEDALIELIIWEIEAGRL